jgi:phage tail-like protein
MTKGGFKVEIRSAGYNAFGYFQEVSGLSVEHEVMEYQEGGNNAFVHKLRGPAKYPNLVLKRGFVEGWGSFLQWFLASQDRSNRGQITIEHMSPNVSGETQKWSFSGIHLIKWQGPDLKQGADEATIETLELAHEGLVT